MGNIIDLSKYQGVLSVAFFTGLKNAGYGRAIFKAGGSNVGRYVDSRYAVNAANARAAGLALGHYWFAGAGDPAGDAAYFYSILSSYQVGDWLVLDNESSATPVWTPAKVNTFNDAIAADTDRAIVLYMSASVTGQFDWSSTVARGVKLWVADYAAAPSYHYWSEYIAWQYTSSGHVPGYSGNVDLDQTGTDTYAVPPTNPLPLEDDMNYLIRHSTGAIAWVFPAAYDGAGSYRHVTGAEYDALKIAYPNLVPVNVTDADWSTLMNTLKPVSGVIGQ